MRQMQMQQAAGQQYAQNDVVPPIQLQPQHGGQQAQQPPMQQQQQKNPAEPISAPLPPIDALADDDVEDLNAAMRELEAEPTVIDVPEVAISPVQKTKTNAQPNRDTDEMIRKMDNSDIIEKVKPLTTREVEESDVMGRKIDMMFSGATTTNIEEKHDYFSPSHNSANDNFDDSFGAAEPMDDAINKIMTDDRAFDEFLKNFDAPQTDGEFKPLERTQKPPADEVEAEAIPVEEEKAKPSAPTTRTYERESRLEKIRREREERRKNTGK